MRGGGWGVEGGERKGVRKIMRENNNPAQRKREREKNGTSDTLLTESMTINLAILRNDRLARNPKIGSQKIGGGRGQERSTKLVSVFPSPDALHIENLKKGT